jgi:hypothetical protein
MVTIGEYAMNSKLINSPVSITSIGFGRNMMTIPKRMEWGGRSYCFIDRGIRATIRRGENLATTVTMSDGERSFCLREQSGSWTLLSVC